MSEEKQLEILESYLTEEDADKLRDMRQERGGVDGNTDYRRPVRSASKKGDGEDTKKKQDSAFDFVVSSLKKKYGDKAIMAKKSEKKED